jgi:hypothetical protein
MMYRPYFYLYLFSLSILTSSLSHASETETANCWDAALYDIDGDGYAIDSAHSGDREEIPSTYADKASCPEGYVAARGDCDDNDSDVHPRRAEVYDNGIDDNCNDLIDEPSFYYRPGGLRNTENSFDIAFSINDAVIYNAYESIFYNLKVEIEYQKLSNTGNTYYSGKKALKSYLAMGPFSYAVASLTGLRKTTVYRARVRFYKTSRFQKRSRYGISTPSEISYTEIGDPSDWYYSTTDGSSDISKARTDILLQGFYEYDQGNHRELVGYRGLSEPDGTRYGAIRGEAWCSEFYSWVGSHALEGMGHKSSVSKMVNYFNEHSAGISSPTLYQVKYKIKRGDYLGEDTHVDDESIKNHSAMFLDYDTHTGQIWTLDGNSHGYNKDPSVYNKSRKAGNEVTLRVRDPEVVLYWGRISKSPLK